MREIMTKEEISKLDLHWQVLIGYEEILRELAQYYGNGDPEIEDACFSDMCFWIPRVVELWDINRGSLRQCIAFQLRWKSAKAARSINRFRTATNRVTISNELEDKNLEMSCAGRLHARAALTILGERLKTDVEHKQIELLSVYYCGKYTLGQLAELMEVSKVTVRNMLLAALETARIALGVPVDVCLGDLTNAEDYWPKSLSPSWQRIKANGQKQCRKQTLTGARRKKTG